MMRNSDNVARDVGGASGDVIERAEALAVQFLSPRASATDQMSAFPKEIVGALAEAKLLALPIPRVYGGSDARFDVIEQVQSIVARACGVTAFMLRRHASCCRALSNGLNEDLKRIYLPKWASGRSLCATALTHVISPGPARVGVRERGSHLEFDGLTPLVSGYGAMELLLLAGAFADGRIAISLVPFQEEANMEISAPIQLSSMRASGTVAVTLKRLLVPAARCVGIFDRPWFAFNEPYYLLSRTTEALAIAEAAIEVLRQNQAANPAANAFARSLLQLRRKAHRGWRNPLRARTAELAAQCHALSVRAAQAAQIAQGGSGLLVASHTDRLLREAMFFSVFAQPLELKLTSLATLSKHSASSDLDSASWGRARSTGRQY